MTPPSPFASATGSARRDRRFLAASAFVALALFVPWAPSFIGAQGDSGFTFMAHYHFAHGMPWGTETLHTTGPWAMLRFPHYFRETFTWMLLLHAATALYIAFILARVASRRLASSTAGMAFVVGCLWLFFMSDDSRWFFILLTFPLLIPDLRTQRTSVPLVAACLFLALCFHVKGTFLIACVPLTVLLAAFELRARRVPWHAAGVIVAVLGWNALAGSEARFIPGYIEFVLGGTAGNPENFSHLGPLYQPVTFLALAGLFMLIVLLVELREHGRGLGLLSFVIIGAVVWMVYRTGFARQDTIHASRSFFTLIPFIACYTVLYWGTIRAAAAESRRFSTRQLALALGAAGALFAWPFVLFLLDYLSIHEGEGKRVLAQLQSVVIVATSGYRHFDAFDESRKKQIAKNYPLPEWLGDAGPVGVHGQLQTPLLAHGFDNVPMPAVAAYENWNPSTVEHAVAWIESSAAPQYMVMSSTGHSSETIRALSQRYDMVRGGWPVILKRREQPRSIHFEELLRTKASFGDRVRVPLGHERDLMRLKMRYRRTWLNRLVSFAYQPVPAYLTLYDGPEVIGRIRLNRMLAEEGLVLATKTFADWDSSSERLHRVRHNLYQDIERPNRLPLTAWRLQLLPALITPEARTPGEKSWLLPSSSWRWYFQPEVEFVLERIVVADREEWVPVAVAKETDSPG